MYNKIESIKFNLTQEMSLELIKFNKLKRQLNDLKELYNLDKNEKLLLQIKELGKKLEKSKNEFIKEFRLNNKEEIINYLKIKDQFWSFFLYKKGNTNFM